MPIATSRGRLGVEVPWLFIGLAFVVAALAAVLVRRHVLRTSGASATADHAIRADFWLVGYGVVTALLSLYYLYTFTSVFRP
jgi:hypothetical protein